MTGWLSKNRSNRWFDLSSLIAYPEVNNRLLRVKQLKAIPVDSIR